MKNKTLLYSAIAAALGVSAAAQAQVDLSPARDGNDDAIAEEVDLDQSDKGLSALPEDITFTAKLGVAGSTTERFFDIELQNGALFADDNLNLEVENTAGGTPGDFDVFPINTPANTNLARFEVDTSSQDFNAGATVTLRFEDSSGNAGAGIFATEESNVGVTSTQTTLPGDPIANTEDTNSIVIIFDPLVDVDIMANDDADEVTIDVTEGSLQFVDGLGSEGATVNLGQVDVTSKPNRFGEFQAGSPSFHDFNAPASGFPTLDEIFDVNEVTISGNFNNAEEIRFFENDSCNNGASNVVVEPITQAIVDDEEVVVDLVGSSPLNGEHTGHVCIEFDGTGEIPEGTYQVSTNGDGAEGYDDKDLGPVDLATLAKNGSEDYVSFASESETQFFRVTNPTDQTGAVFATIFDADGNSCRLVLDQIDDRFGTPLPNPVVAQGGTPLFQGTGLAAAAADNVSASDCDPLDFDNGVRLRVEAEFGDNDADGRETASGVAASVRLDAYSDSGFSPNR